MSLKTWIKRYIKNKPLAFKEFALLYRVSIGKRYVDVWFNGSYRGADGKWFRVGSTKRGFGLDKTYDHNEFPEVKGEIKKLSPQYRND